MLTGLQLRDFALAERVDLELGGGFTVITGEAGAGKSVLIDALAFALGAPADAEMIRPGAELAEVEAIFDLSAAAARHRVARALDDAGIPFEDELIVRRSVARPQHGSRRLGGRLRVNDRAATTSLLRELSPILADIHGQREHLSLLRPHEQLALLDRYAGVEHQRDAVSAMARKLRLLDQRIADLNLQGRERARRMALLRHEAQEIAVAGLAIGEDAELAAQHRRLVNAQALASDTQTARNALESDTLSDALAAVRDLAALDDTAAPIARAVEEAAEQVAEAVRSLRSYADEIDLDPARLESVEARIALINEMKRRWGDTIEEVIAYGEQAEEEANGLEQDSADRETLAAEANQLEADFVDAAAELSTQRQAAAMRLEAAVAAECELLRLPDARIEFEIARIPASAEGRVLRIDGVRVGFDQTGIDRVQLMVSFNPDAPLRLMQRVASGGETARLTLAIKAVMGESDVVPLMVFDEVDVGLGGRSGGMIGERLARLGECSQVVCITHLPQVAAQAERHVTVAKSSDANGTAVEVRVLSEQERVIELAEMLGGVSEANRASAVDLLHASVAL
ncbi:MAG: DNA repair protein RecN [Chloroflexi bacterium]|nr:DNA repair protein RecN [Chloroflexota bacterium]MYD17338.1 DNA repair protein RecN [Chloroflexota bacterium]